jgi:isopentenyl diphosphate isomerase/L-lactate dehydrogenase-like FMN-dependent dehydrogenase
MTTWAKELDGLTKETLDQKTYDFLSCGAGNEWGIANNRKALDAYSFIPRVLRNVETIDSSINLFGKSYPFPMLIAPTAPHNLFHHQGEIQTAIGAQSSKTPMIVSCMASQLFEDIAKESQDLWLQLNLFKDKGLMQHLVQKAESLDFKALVLTVDMPILGNRPKNKKNHFTIPEISLPINLLNDHHNIPQKAHSQEYLSDQLLDPSACWDIIETIHKWSNLPILLKGILHPEDAKIAIQKPISGVIVSNHGARQLNDTIAPIDALSSIAKIIDKKMLLLMDGGIRSGADILKAQILGADAVLIGRPILWGLACFADKGVSYVLSQLQKELHETMALCGLPCQQALQEITMPMLHHQ